MYITDKELYITELIRVMRAEHTYKEKANAVCDRYSDCLVFVLGGSCKYTFEDGNAFTVNEGDILYLARHSSYKMERGREGYCVIFCDFFFGGEERRSSAFYRVGKQSQAETYFRRLYKSFVSGSAGGFSEQMAALYAVYNEIALYFSSEYVRADNRSIVERAKGWMDERYGDGGLSVSALAEGCGFSEVYFRKLFRSIYRISPSEYLYSVRLKNAERFLLHTNLSIEECARACGFSAAGYFCRVFKAAYGVSPARYRREHGGASDKYGV